MLGSGNPTPYDLPLIGLLVVIAVLLFAGSATASAWSPATATIVRRGGLLLAVAATAVVMVVTPTTNGIIGAGRVLMVWPAFGATVLGYLIWSWRAGRL